MEAVQITTLVLVAALFIMEGLKIVSAFTASSIRKNQHQEMERLLEALENGEVEGTKTEIEIPKKKD